MGAGIINKVRVGAYTYDIVITCDEEMDETSINALMNKTITRAFRDLEKKMPGEVLYDEQGNKLGVVIGVKKNTLLAPTQSMTVTGEYNDSSTSGTGGNECLFAVGNGTQAQRSNAIEIKRNGKIYFKSETGAEQVLQTVTSPITNNEIDDIISDIMR